MGRGFLLAFEGIDGSGKSTQLGLLAQWLGNKRIPYECLAQPSGSKAGRILRTLAERGERLPPNRELALFLRDRREQAKAIIRPLLSEGVVVLLDRYYLSSVAYQGAVGLDPERILKTCLTFSPIPDATFLVDLDPWKALRRIKKSRTTDAFEQAEYLAKVRDLYLEWGSRHSGVIILDGASEPQVLFAKVEMAVMKLLEKHGILGSASS